MAAPLVSLMGYNLRNVKMVYPGISSAFISNLYHNDTFVAEVDVGASGHGVVKFGRGVTPGLMQRIVKDITALLGHARFAPEHRFVFAKRFMATPEKAAEGWAYLLMELLRFRAEAGNYRGKAYRVMGIFRGAVIYSDMHLGYAEIELLPEKFKLLPDAYNEGLLSLKQFEPKWGSLLGVLVYNKDTSWHFNRFDYQAIFDPEAVRWAGGV